MSTQPDSAQVLPRRRAIITGLILAIGLSVASILVVLFLTMDRQTWSAVANINPLLVLASVGLLVLKWAAHVLRTKLLIRASGNELGTWSTTKAMLGGTFTGAVTPFLAAEIPVEIYFLHGYGIGAAPATALVTVGSTMSTLLFVIVMPVVLLTAAARVHLQVGLRAFLIVAGFAALVLLVVVLLSMRDPERMIARIQRFTPRFLSRREWFERGAQAFFRAVASFSESLRIILGFSKSVLALAALLTLLLWTTVIFIPGLMLWGLGYRYLFWQAILAQMVVSYLLPFSPTPGQSGVAEATFAGVYATFVPAHLVGALALLWRFFTFYLALAVTGAAFVLASRDSLRAARDKAKPEPAPDIVESE